MRSWAKKESDTITSTTIGAISNGKHQRATASKATEFDSVIYMPNGETILAYSEKTMQKGGMTMPTEWKLGIPVYFRGTIYSVPVMVKYRVGGGKVTFSMKVDSVDIIEDAAFQETTAALAKDTGIEIYLGKA